MSISIVHVTQNTILKYVYKSLINHVSLNLSITIS